MVDHGSLPSPDDRAVTGLAVLRSRRAAFLPLVCTVVVAAAAIGTVGAGAGLTSARSLSIDAAPMLGCPTELPDRVSATIVLGDSDATADEKLLRRAQCSLTLDSYGAEIGGRFRLAGTLLISLCAAVATVVVALGTLGRAVREAPATLRRAVFGAAAAAAVLLVAELVAVSGSEQLLRARAAVELRYEAGVLSSWRLQPLFVSIIRLRSDTLGDYAELATLVVSSLTTLGGVAVVLAACFALHEPGRTAEVAARQTARLNTLLYMTSIMLVAGVIAMTQYRTWVGDMLLGDPESVAPVRERLLDGGGGEVFAFGVCHSLLIGAFYLPAILLIGRGQPRATDDRPVRLGDRSVRVALRMLAILGPAIAQQALEFLGS